MSGKKERQTRSREGGRAPLPVYGKAIANHACTRMTSTWDESVLSASAPGSIAGRDVKVSIIMLTYNRPQFIDRAIQSVIDQDYSFWELIIVHDGPDGGCREVVRGFEQRDARIRYFYREKGGNIANATNFGLKQARGEYIAILDDDDYWAAKNKLSKQVAFLDHHPDHAACGSGVIVVNERGLEKLRYIKHPDDQTLRRWALLANPIHHSTSMFRTTLITKCGFYDESLPGFQDWDVFLKLGQEGKFHNIPENLVCYRIWDGNGSFTAHHANTAAAMRILWRHGKSYRGFSMALCFAGAHYFYARLPRRLKKWSFAALSRTKKAIFSDRKYRAQPPIAPQSPLR